jgi:hypothetical protein
MKRSEQNMVEQKPHSHNKSYFALLIFLLLQILFYAWLSTYYQ